MDRLIELLEKALEEFNFRKSGQYSVEIVELMENVEMFLENYNRNYGG